MPTPAHSGPDTSHSGRTQTAGPSSSAAAFVPVPVVVVVLGHALQRASVTPALELEVVVAAPHSASVLEAVFERGAETGSGAAVGSAATVGVTAVGLGDGLGPELSCPG